MKFEIGDSATIETEFGGFDGKEGIVSKTFTGSIYPYELEVEGNRRQYREDELTLIIEEKMMKFKVGDRVVIKEGNHSFQHGVGTVLGTEAWTASRIDVRFDGYRYSPSSNEKYNKQDFHSPPIADLELVKVAFEEGKNYKCIKPCSSSAHALIKEEVYTCVMTDDRVDDSTVDDSTVRLEGKFTDRTVKKQYFWKKQGGFQTPWDEFVTCFVEVEEELDIDFFGLATDCLELHKEFLGLHVQQIKEQ